MMGQDTHREWQAAVRVLPKTQHYLWHWHLMRMEGGARQLGFGGSTGDRMADPGANSDVIVLGCFVDGHLRGAVALRWQESGRRRRASVTFSVEQRWRGQGIGTALMAAAIEAAQERGIANLHLTCHALNGRMQRIAERHRAAIGFEGCEFFADLEVGEPAGA